MKRMTELEQKMTTINHQPVLMPPEKEEMLHNTINRADLLEKELLATKKVFNLLEQHIWFERKQINKMHTRAQTIDHIVRLIVPTFPTAKWLM